MATPAANALARILKTENVPWVSTYPVCGVNNALGQEGIPIIMMRDDRYAVALADAFSRVTNGNKIGVCTVMGGTNAAGLQMAYGALAQAYIDGSPLLCISDGIPVGAGGRGRFDITEGLAPVAKWIGHIDQPHRVPEIMRRAFTLLRTGRPGPVLVTIPRGTAGEYDEEAHPYKPVKGWRSAPDPDDVRAAVEALLSAKNPLLYAGEGILYANAADELKAFAELAQLPVLTTLKAKSVFPEDHPLSIGVRGGPANEFLTNCDVLLAIGTSLGQGHFRHNVPNPEKKTIIHCTNDPFDVNNSYRSEYAVIGDARLTLQALADEVAARTNGGVRKNVRLTARIKELKEKLIAEFRPHMESDDVPINPYRVYGDLIKVLDPHNSFVTHDSGTTRDQLSTVYQTLISRGFSGWGNISTLGFGLPLAMAAKLAYPDRQCVNVTGEGGVAYMMGNFEALVRYRIGVTTIHNCNDVFSAYGPGFWGPGHDPYTATVTNHHTVNMAAAVRELGYHAERVTQPADIVPALERALQRNADGQPAYLEIICCEYPSFPRFMSGGPPA